MAGNQIDENKSAIFTNTSNIANHYIIIKDQAPVFLNSQVYLSKKRTKVSARPHPKHRNFHQVIIKKKSIQ